MLVKFSSFVQSWKLQFEGSEIVQHLHCSQAWSSH